MCRKVEHHHEIVYPDAIAATRGLDSLFGCLDEDAAYFWSHVAYCTEGDATSALFGACEHAPRILQDRRDHSSPYIVHVRSSNAALFAIRGSNTPSDFMTVLDVSSCTPATILKRMQAPSPKPSDLLHFYITNRLSRLPASSRIHAGIFMHAYKCLRLMWPHVVGDQHTDTVHLYGHSLGAACASLLYVWLRELNDLMMTPTQTSSLNVQCACMACPMFSNDAAWEAWFRQHDRLEYVHYYTIGDPFVKRVPGLVGLTKAVSATHLVCPSIIDCLPCTRNDVSTASCTMKAALVAHSCFRSGGFVRVSDVPPVMLTRASTRPQRILMSPKYLEQFRPQATSRLMVIRRSFVR